MKKIITKFWGVALVVVLLSSLFVFAVPASAGNYAFSLDPTFPTVGNGLLAKAAGIGTSSVSQTADGSSSYLSTTSNNPAVAPYL